MKKLTLITHLSFGIIIFLISSCTIEKRVHMSGYHIDWKRSQPKAEARSNSRIELMPKKQTAKLDQLLTTSVESDSLPAMSIEHSNFIASADEEVGVVVPVIATKTKTESVSSSSFQSSKSNEISSRKVAKVKKLAIKSKSSSGGKSQVVALVLCIFLGLLGIHRFYLGYTGMGVLYLLTAGILGIGWIIDIILLLIPNGLTPKGKTSYND